jgi:hypothetical protein
MHILDSGRNHGAGKNGLSSALIGSGTLLPPPPPKFCTKQNTANRQSGWDAKAK